MRITSTKRQVLAGNPIVRPTGYTLWLSSRETYDWAHKPGAAWPCCGFSGSRLCVGVDSNGLEGLTINGRDSDCDPDALKAIVADHLPLHVQHLWPVWAR